MIQAAQDIQECRLARSGGADDGDEFAAIDVQRHVRERGDLGVAGHELAANVAERQNRFGHVTIPLAGHLAGKPREVGPLIDDSPVMTCSPSAEAGLDFHGGAIA
ncbi:hypothetical protein BRDID11002_11100 [Bradyrhizobium diazoefficiens]